MPAGGDGGLPASLASFAFPCGHPSALTPTPVSIIRSLPGSPATYFQSQNGPPCSWCSRNNTPRVITTAGPIRLRIVQLWHLHRTSFPIFPLLSNGPAPYFWSLMRFLSNTTPIPISTPGQKNLAESGNSSKIPKLFSRIKAPTPIRMIGPSGCFALHNLDRILQGFLQFAGIWPSAARQSAI